jgi:hypothetical protein
VAGAVSVWAVVIQVFGGAVDIVVGSHCGTTSFCLTSFLTHQ